MATRKACPKCNLPSTFEEIVTSEYEALVRVLSVLSLIPWILAWRSTFTCVCSVDSSTAKPKRRRSEVSSPWSLMVHAQSSCVAPCDRSCQPALDAERQVGCAA